MFLSSAFAPSPHLSSDPIVYFYAYKVVVFWLRKNLYKSNSQNWLTNYPADFGCRAAMQACRTPGCLRQLASASNPVTRRDSSPAHSPNSRLAISSLNILRGGNSSGTDAQKKTKITTSRPELWAEWDLEKETSGKGAKRRCNKESRGKVWLWS